MTDLTFQFPSAGGSPTAVDLTFGATPGPAPAIDATFNARFTLRGAAVVGYDTAVWRGMVTNFVSVNSQAAHRERVVDGPWRDPTQGERNTAARYDTATPVGTRTASQWQPPVTASRTARAQWARGRGEGSSTSAQWVHPVVASRTAVSVWQRGDQVGAGVRSGFDLAAQAEKLARSVWQEGMERERVLEAPSNAAAKPLHRSVDSVWQTGLVLGSDGGPRYLPPPPSVVPTRPDVVVGVQFCAAGPAGTTLIFGLNPCGGVTPDSPIYILPARFYMAVHSITAATFPGNVPVRITDVSLAADMDSTVWSFSARGPVELFEQLAPTAGAPAQITINIDGIEWLFLVDKLTFDEKFGSRGTAISGRSVTALIGQPYARETARLSTTSRNAQQLAADALALSGVGLDWGIADWLVPAGAWSHTGTPLAAVQAVAQAAGGFVNSHRNAPTVLVRHPYPTLPGGVPGGPWNWGGAFAADVELAPDAIISKSLERVDGPDIDGIYVSGTTQGVLAHVYRQGTLGAKLAGMETDALITAAAAANQRGLAVLGAAGAKHMVQMTIPVLTGGANPGVLDVGQLVQINESVPWRGRVRSVSVQANLRQVRQSFSLERHLA